MLKPLTTLAALAIVASALVGAVATAIAGAPQITHFTLSNGLEVVVIPDHRAPVVTHMLWYKVGSADETPGKSGLAHFLEHLMFKGTEKNPSGRFSQVVATIGNLFRVRAVRESFRANLAPEIDVRQPLGSGVDGALLLAGASTNGTLPANAPCERFTAPGKSR